MYRNNHIAQVSKKAVYIQNAEATIGIHHEKTSNYRVPAPGIQAISAKNMTKRVRDKIEEYDRLIKNEEYEKAYCIFAEYADVMPRRCANKIMIIYMCMYIYKYKKQPVGCTINDLIKDEYICRGHWGSPKFDMNLKTLYRILCWQCVQCGGNINYSYEYRDMYGKYLFKMAIMLVPNFASYVLSTYDRGGIYKTMDRYEITKYIYNVFRILSNTESKYENMEIRSLCFYIPEIICVLDDASVVCLYGKNIWFKRHIRNSYLYIFDLV